jgi:hypothetical protein
MAAPRATNIPCSDPFHIKCTNTVTPGFNLPNSPHRQSKVPCQKCKYEARMRERARQGLPPTRTGAGSKDRL